MKKSILTVLGLGLILSGLAAGCGEKGSTADAAAAQQNTLAGEGAGMAGNPTTAEQGTAEAAADGKTRLNILWWGSQTRHELTTKMLQKFEELNPDIEVVMDYSDWDGYWTKLPAQVAGGQVPDVFQMDYSYLSQYANNGVLAPLDEYIEGKQLELGDVEENIIDTGKVGGKTYGISTGTNAPVMLYRKDVLDELGLNLPMNPTMSEYCKVSRAVYEATGLRDTYITDSSLNILQIHLRNYGLSVYNEDATALGFDEPKVLVNMWKLALQAQDEGWGLKPGEATATTAFDSMVTDAWSRYQNSNELKAYRDATGKDIRMVMLPKMDDATTPAAFLKPAMFWCVSADSKVKDAAVRFIDFFTNSEACYDIVGIERAVPISEKMRAYVAPKLDEVGKEVVDFVDYASQPGMSSPLMKPAPECDAAVTDLLAQYSEQVRYGKLTDLDKAARDFMKEANELIASSAAAKK